MEKEKKESKLKKIATSIKEKTKNFLDKSKENKKIKQKIKLNPLMPEEFKSENFYIPNIITIVDDAVRRDNELCQGAIGWRENIANTEVLFLYDEFVPQSNIEFIPKIDCDAVYYIDSHNHNRYIRTDCIFSRSHEEKLAELKHIAHCLGAKSCSVEIKETYLENNQKDMSISNDKSSGNYKSNSKIFEKREGLSEIIFDGSDKPIMPTLKWFANDDNIKRLIDMRINSTNSIKSETLKLLGSSSSTLSQKTAVTLDNFMKKFGKINTNLTQESNKESESVLIYKITF